MTMRIAILANLVLCTLASSANWGYEGSNGPENWSAQCAVGKSQSPIDIPSKNQIESKMEPFVFLGYDAKPKTSHLKNNGHTVQMGFELHRGQQMPTVYKGGLPGKYRFAQFHFHWGSTDTRGSEHTIDSTSYPMEIHLVHYNAKYGSDLSGAVGASKGASDTLAVLGIFFEIQNKDNPKLVSIIKAAKEAVGKGDKAGMDPFPLADVLPRNTDSFYRYQGSLTTPGCNEIVVWTVFKDPVGISSVQMAQFRALLEDVKGGSNKKLEDNFRPVQQLNGRHIEDVETSSKLFKTSSATHCMVTVTTLILASTLSRFL